MVLIFVKGRDWEREDGEKNYLLPQMQRMMTTKMIMTLTKVVAVVVVAEAAMQA